MTSNSCSCLNVTRPSGKSPFQCACCSDSSQTNPQPQCYGGATSQQCSCVNTTGLYANSSTYNCNCAYMNTGNVITGLNMTQQLCGCPQTTSTVKPCTCCVFQAQYAASLAPTCPAD